MGFREWLTGAGVDPYAGVVPTPDGIPADIPWVQHAQPLPYNAPRPLTAAARKIDLKSKNDLAAMYDQPYTEWQDEAWEYFDAIGEIKYALRLAGAVMSRIRLYAAVVVEEDAPPTSSLDFLRKRTATEGPESETAENDTLKMPVGLTEDILKAAKEAMDALGSGNGGIPGLLASYALNISVPGECYLVNYQNRWSIRSTSEITVRKSDGKAVMRTTRLAVRNGVSPAASDQRITEVELPKGTYIGRIWQPHPRYSDEPDSSMMALRELCGELMTLERMIRSTARSRMNAGLLFLPDGLSVAAKTPGAEELEADPLEFELMTAMVTPVADEASAANVVPMVVRGPAELGQQIKYLTFARDGDRALIERADRVLERILQGLDVPKDIITGLANIKYTNAVAIDDSLYKAHIEPLALMLVDALTIMYLRPAVKAAIGEDLTDEALKRLVVWYDPTEIVTKPDPATAADTGYDKHLLSGDAWRRSHGFSEIDAPTEDELANRIVQEQLLIDPALFGNPLMNHYIPTVLEAEKQNSREKLPVPFPQSARDILDGQQAVEDQNAQNEPTPTETEPAPTAPTGTAFAPGTEVTA